MLDAVDREAFSCPYIHDDPETRTMAKITHTALQEKPDRPLLVDEVTQTLVSFPEVSAVALGCSYARGLQDQMSDIDICVYAQPDIPAADARRARYAQAGWSDLNYFDARHDVIVEDGFRVGKQDIEVLWMQIPLAERFLQSLSTDFDCSEFLPGGLLLVEPLHDPQCVIEKLRALALEYPIARSKYRTAHHLRQASFSFSVLRVFCKAAFRRDPYLFLKGQYEALDCFFSALFALNRQWFCHEKRLIDMVGSFRLAPDRVQSRLRRITQRQGSCRSLGGCLQEMKSLFEELSSIAQQTYPDIVPPEY
jgi:predicted nucleotidyltransferase